MRRAETSPVLLLLVLLLSLVVAGLALVGCSGNVDDARGPEIVQDIDEIAVAPSTGLTPIAPSRFCATSGALASSAGHTMRVDAAGMRGVVAGDRSRTAELAFRYQGPSRDEAPLANGELRRQLGLKLRAQDTCNVVYVTWQVAPRPGIFVSVKHNPGQSTHAECGDRGYVQVASRQPHGAAPDPARQDTHVLRAEVDGRELTVFADGVLAWQGTLPAEALAFDGPVGTRSDNGAFDFELSVPGGSRADVACDGADGAARD